MPGAEQNNNMNDTSTSSVLFFVALGVGIVLANLFAFMGIRYCCRRRRHPEEFNNREPQETNARLRYRTRTSRRKKPKLMTIEVVEEKFPLKSYKEAKAEQPVDVDEPSRTVKPKASMVDEKGEDDEETVDHQDVSEQSKAVDKSVDKNEPEKTATDAFNDAGKIEEQHEHAEQDATSLEHDDDMLYGVDSEDTCAVCIETMDDDDRVRLLTCGHIFHGECIDPWLTVRRACCPLCKADYYVKPPQDSNNNNNEDGTEMTRQSVVEERSSDSRAAARRRRAALYNIWGRRHHENSSVQQQESNDDDDGDGRSASSRFRQFMRLERPQPARVRPSPSQSSSHHDIRPVSQAQVASTMVV